MTFSSSIWSKTKIYGARYTESCVAAEKSRRDLWIDVILRQYRLLLLKKIQLEKNDTCRQDAFHFPERTWFLCEHFTVQLAFPKVKSCDAPDHFRSCCPLARVVLQVNNAGPAPRSDGAVLSLGCVCPRHWRGPSHLRKLCLTVHSTLNARFSCCTPSIGVLLRVCWQQWKQREPRRANATNGWGWKGRGVDVELKTGLGHSTIIRRRGVVVPDWRYSWWSFCKEHTTLFLLETRCRAYDQSRLESTLQMEIKGVYKLLQSTALWLYLSVLRRCFNVRFSPQQEQSLTICFYSRVRIPFHEIINTADSWLSKNDFCFKVCGGSTKT